MALLGERPLLCVIVGLMGGSMLGETLSLSPQLIGIMLGAIGLVLPRWPYPQLQWCCRLALTGCLLTHLSLAWQYRALPLNHITHVLPEAAVTRLTVEGRLYRPVESHGDRQRLYLQLQRFQDADGWHEVQGRARLSVHADDLPFLPGDRVRIERLRLHRVRGFRNPGSFDFQRFMQRRGIYVIGGMSNPERVRLQQRLEGFSLARTLVQWRRRLQALVHTSLPSPYAAVLLGMVVGHRGALPATIEEHFRIAGTAHLLVVSGLHVGFVTMAVLFGLRACLRFLRSWLPRTWLPGWRPTPVAALCCIPAVLLYCSVVGWKVSTLRAALMVGSCILALVFDRSRLLMHALGLAAALILLLDPDALFALDFQLSFMAVAAIALVSQRLLRQPDHPGLVRRWGQRLRAATAASSAAYLATLPFIVGAFHTLPTYGIVANILIMPLASALVPAGVVALSLAALWPALTPVVFAPLLPLLTWTLGLMQTIAALPHAQIHVAALSAAAYVGYYGLLGSLLWARRGHQRRASVALCTALLLMSIGWQYYDTRARQLRITFLDVGTGDAILVQVPGNHNLLIDGGGTYDGRFDIGAKVVAPVLWQRHIRRFDLMALTHTHPNHARGLVSLFRLFPTQHLLSNGTPLSADYFRDLLTVGAQRGTQMHTATDGPRQWRWGRLQLTVLAPPEATAPQQAAWKPRTENDRSLVIRLQYGAVRVLLTGDIEHATERWLLTQNLDLRADILHIPHHGSRTSSLPAFIKRVQPQVGIISVGAGNPYGHPHPQVLRTLSEQRLQVFRTDLHGAITITSDGTRYWVTQFRP
jgi:competence protein ComEC